MSVGVGGIVTDINFEEYWGVVKCKPGQEWRANSNLVAQGFRTLLPFQKTTMRRANKFVERRAALFPSYLFVVLSAATYRRVASTFGVGHIITGNHGVAKRIDDAIVCSIEDNCDETGLFRPAEAFSEGDRVEILRGPFTSAIAEVQSAPSSERLWLFLEIMGQSAAIEVDARDTRKV